MLALQLRSCAARHLPLQTQLHGSPGACTSAAACCAMVCVAPVKCQEMGTAHMGADDYFLFQLTLAQGTRQAIVPTLLLGCRAWACRPASHKQAARQTIKCASVGTWALGLNQQSSAATLVEACVPRSGSSADRLAAQMRPSVVNLHTSFAVQMKPS